MMYIYIYTNVLAGRLTARKTILRPEESRKHEKTRGFSATGRDSTSFQSLLEAQNTRQIEVFVGRGLKTTRKHKGLSNTRENIRF